MKALVDPGLSPSLHELRATAEELHAAIQGIANAAQFAQQEDQRLWVAIDRHESAETDRKVLRSVASANRTRDEA